jgi:putative endonuclease
MTPSLTKHAGDIAENTACEYLLQHGLTMISRNYRCRSGEIDLIMQDQSQLVFVEVRLRNNPDFGDGLESITKHKIKRLVSAAEYFLLQHPEYGDAPCRFDVISLSGKPANHGIEWIRDAFTSD